MCGLAAPFSAPARQQTLGWPNNQANPRSTTQQNFVHHGWRNRNAASRVINTEAGQMKENRATRTFDTGALIVIGWKHHVIGTVIAPHAFMAAIQRQRHGSIVMARSRIIAPAIDLAHGTQHLLVGGPAQTVSTKVALPQLPESDG